MAAAIVSVGLVASYVGLGGGRYEPFSVADPCQVRPWRAPDGAAQIAEQAALSALDGAACKLGVSREEITRAVATQADVERFASDRGISQQDVENALRDGLKRAVDDAQAADALNGVEAFVLRQAAGQIPIDRLLAAVRDGNLSFSDLTP
jgi:hypothetical protein